MMVLEFRNGKPIRAWHNVDCARRSLGPDADIRELDNELPEVQNYLAAEKAKRDIASVEENNMRVMRNKVDELLGKQDINNVELKVLVLNMAKLLRSKM